MTEGLTCCPHCGASFRISEEQLDTAKGAVRCGSCLRIFKAMEHLVDSTATLPIIPTPDNRTTPSDALTFNDDDLEDLTLDQDLDLNALDKQLDEDIEALFRQPLEQADSPIDPTEDEVYAELDEEIDKLLADADQIMDSGDHGHLIDDEDDVETDKKAPADVPPRPTWLADDGDDSHDNDDPLPFTTDELEALDGDAACLGDTQTVFLQDMGDAPESQRGQFGEHPGALFDRQLKVVESHQPHHTDETWAVSLLEDADRPLNNDATDPSISLPPNTYTVGQFYADHSGPNPAIDPGQSYTALEAISARCDDVQDHDSINSAEGVSQFDDIETTTSPSTSAVSDTPLIAIEEPLDLLKQLPEPDVDIEAETPKQPQTRSSQWGWGIVLLLAIAALPAQWLYYHWDNLLQDPKAHGMLSRACDALGCQLPPIQQPEQIKVTELVVRSHPERDSALMIDSILLNTAVQPQPFPDFVLTFSDLKNVVVASRRFVPSEYLHGELQGTSKIPSRQPVRITLEIDDPGQQAINYHARVLPSKADREQ